MALQRLGGRASARALLRLSTRREVRRALAEGRIERTARGRYVLPTAREAVRAAARLSGTVAGRSAAALHGWGLAREPEHPEIAVRPDRRLPAERRDGVRVLWMPVGTDDLEAGVTAPLRTVLDCARRRPFAEALAIADSALRSGSVTEVELTGARVRGPGAAAVRRVIRAADARAANPFESVLRALCLEAGLAVVPQRAIRLGTGTVHPDLVCPAARAVFEADSWTHHAHRRGHRTDCARYNLLSLAGWRVFRFTWEQVMHEPDYVRWVLLNLELSAGPWRPLARPA